MKFLGNIDPGELQQAYRRAAVTASLSEREAFGITLLEAVASGCPVVASDVPSHREIRSATHGVSLVDPSSGAAVIA